MSESAYEYKSETTEPSQTAEVSEVPSDTTSVMRREIHFIAKEIALERNRR